MTSIRKQYNSGLYATIAPIEFQHIDGDASKPHNYNFSKCSGETKNSLISLLILMSLVLAKCVFNRLIIDIRLFEVVTHYSKDSNL